MRDTADETQARPSRQGSSDQPTFRFAPTPNGFLHLGHAYSALLNERLAREVDGRLLLRFEDIDPERCRPEFENAIEADLRWLDIAWEEPVRHQSTRFPLYQAALDRLVARALAYPCFCTRGMIREAVAGRQGWPSDPDGAPLYPGTCKLLNEAERAARLASPPPHHWRLDMAAALAEAARPLEWLSLDEGGGPPTRITAAPAAWGDAVIARNGRPTSYHLCVVVDDADQGVTDVVRGLDLRPATDIHRLLQHLLGLPVPRYRHHRLFLDADGQKLSKSPDAPTLRAWREAGIPGFRVREELGF